MLNYNRSKTIFTVCLRPYFIGVALFAVSSIYAGAEGFIGKLPERKPDALTGSSFIKKVEDLSFDLREKEIVDEILSGNIPGFLRNTVPISYTRVDKEGRSYLVEIRVFPDYLSIGSDDDFVRIPMGPIAAQRIADSLGASMPTRLIVDTIDSRAQARLAPFPFRPKGERNTWPIVFEDHNKVINALFDEAELTPGMLVSGLKKDVVITNKLSDPLRTHHVTIYGWHYKNGKPIQPLYNGHIDIYVDYSHGIRLISRSIKVNGEIMDIEDILKSPDLYFLLSDEEGAMERSRY